jgi:DNA-binding NtrC family response regulator
VRLPPLRERADDLPELVHALLERMGAGDSARLFTPQILATLAQHEWPGNVRELRNYVERAVVLQDATSPSRALRAPAAPETVTHELPGEVNIEAPFKTAKEALIASFERAYLVELMAWAGGNVSRASRKAKLDRMYLHRLLQRYGLKRDDE